MRRRYRDTGPDRETRMLVLERDGAACICCGRAVLGRLGHSLQHRQARGMGGTKDPSRNSPVNLITVCGLLATDPDSCHFWIEQRHEQARELGYWVPSWQDPAEVPVHVVGIGVVWLDPDGYYIPAPHLEDPW